MRTQITRFTFTLIVTLAVLGCTAAQKHEPANGRIVPAPQMHDARADHTATLLRDGRVLITGGMVENGVFLASAELFDPKTSRFEKLPNMNERRVGHTASLLPDGRVVIAGGSSDREYVDGNWQGVMAKSIEIYDPQTKRFVRVGDMRTPRSSHAALALADGRVVFLGGYNQRRQLDSVEIFDSRTGKLDDGGTLQTAREGLGAALLKNGKILLAGGSKSDSELNGSIELYDPATRKSTVIGQLQTPRRKHATVLLDDGRVLIVGGSNTSDWTGQYATAEVIDVRSGKSTLVSNMAQQRFKINHAVVVLKDGSVLVAGGKAQAERFDPTKARFTSIAGDMGAPHYFSTATLLSDGRVLVAGGYGSGGLGRGPLSTRDSWLFIP